MTESEKIMKYSVQKKIVHTNIKRLRERAKLTQLQLAKKAKITVSMVCRIESGQRDVNLKLLVKLAAGLGVMPVQLLRDPQMERVRRRKPAVAETDQPMGVAIMLGAPAQQ